MNSPFHYIGYKIVETFYVNGLGWLLELLYAGRYVIFYAFLAALIIINIKTFIDVFDLKKKFHKKFHRFN